MPTHGTNVMASLARRAPGPSNPRPTRPQLKFPQWVVRTTPGGKSSKWTWLWKVCVASADVGLLPVSSVEAGKT